MKLSIVIPCYNESKDIKKNTLLVQEYLRNLKIDYELYVNNDKVSDSKIELNVSDN